MTSLYQDTVKQDQHPDTVDNEILQRFEQLLVHGLDKAATLSRTGKLWVQYVYYYYYYYYYYLFIKTPTSEENILYCILHPYTRITVYVLKAGQ